MNYYDILFAKKMGGGEAPPEDSYQLKSITTPTSLATFEASAMPMPKLKVSVEAKQDLHGYDKPWVGGSGKNKLSIADKTATTVDNLTITINKDADGNINGIKLDGSLTRNSYGYEFFAETLPAGSYILNADFGISTQVGSQVLLLYSDDYTTTYAFVRPAKPSVSFTLSSDTKIRAQLYTYKNYNYSNIIIKPMLRLATEADPTFAPYSNICPISGWDEANVSDVDDVENPTVTQTTTISLGQTVYGGELDVVNGTSGNKITHSVVDLGDLTWSASTDSQGQFFQTPEGEVTGIKHGTLNCICSCYEVVSSSSVNDGNIAVGQTGRIYVRDNNYSSASDFKTAIAGQTLVYELATPTTFTTQPTPIKSLNGQNNLSVDCGEVIEGEYFKAL